jgi:hypothetical protein
MIRTAADRMALMKVIKVASKQQLWAASDWTIASCS